MKKDVFVIALFISINAWGGTSQWIQDLKNPNTLIQSDALFQLEKEGEKAVPLLMKALASSHTPWRIKILYLLAKQGKKEILPLLREEFKKGNVEDARMGRTLFLSLGFIGESQDIPRMLEYNVLNEEHWMYLYQIAKRDLKSFLKGLYAKDPFFQLGSEEAIKVIQALPLSSSHLITIFQTGEAPYQAGVLFMLRHRKSKGVEPFFKVGFKSSNPAVLYQAIIGAGEYEMTSLFPELISVIPKVLSLGQESQRLQEALSVAIPKLEVTNFNIKLLWKRASLAQISEKIVDTKLLLAMDSSVLSLEEQTYFKEDMAIFQDQAGAYLETMLRQNDKDLTKRDWIFQQMAGLRIKRFSRDLITYLNDSRASNAAKKAILEYLGTGVCDRGEAVLSGFLREPKFEYSAIQSLRRLKSLNAIHFLIEHLKHNTSSYDDQIIGALNEMYQSHPYPHFEDIIFPFLVSPRGETRLKALEGLSQLKPPYWEDVLISFILYNDDSIRLFVFQELAKIKSKKSVPHLIQCLSLENPLVMHELLKTLVAIGDARALAPIRLTMLTAENIEIKQRAQWAASQLSKK